MHLHRLSRKAAYLDPSQKTPGFFAKPPTFFAKAPSWMYDWVPNTPLERFVQNTPRKELAIASVKKCFAWQYCH